MARVLLGLLLFSLYGLGQPLVLRIRVLDGDGAVRPPGSRAGNALVVEVTDEIGRPVPEATVSLQLPDSGPSGVFATGLRTEIGQTDAQGRAAVRNFRLNSVPGPFDIRITAAKQGARAGMLSRQYIGGAAISGAKESRSTRKKWMILAGIAAGAAVAGVAAAGGSTAAPSMPPAAPAPPALTIGAPVEIAIGAPR